MSPTATTTRPAAAGSHPCAGQRRRRRTGRRWVRPVLVVAVALVLLTSAGWLVLGSTALAAQRVTVTGAKELTQDQVRSAAQVPLGRPLARQDLGTIARRTGQLPQLSQVRVTRDWPTTIQITVVERKPLLAVAQPGGFVLIDKTGTPYESRGSVPIGVVQADVNPDDRALLSEVGTVAESLTGSLGKAVVRISATDRDNIRVRLESGLVVTWGDSSDSALKAQLTTALLKRKPRVSIDVSSPHTPAIR